MGKNKHEEESNSRMNPQRRGRYARYGVTACVYIPAYDTQVHAYICIPYVLTFTDIHIQMAIQDAPNGRLIDKPLELSRDAPNERFVSTDTFGVEDLINDGIGAKTGL